MQVIIPRHRRICSTISRKIPFLFIQAIFRWLVQFATEELADVIAFRLVDGDNMGAAALARDAKGHARNKHIDIREHYIRERVAAGNLVDIFTKILPRDSHLAIARALGLND
jgi:hypothetical protein